jgi:hypothetical protein
MRRDEYDIKEFNFNQLTNFVEYVADSQPEDLSMFAKYIDIAISRSFFGEKEITE